MGMRRERLRDPPQAHCPTPPCEEAVRVPACRGSPPSPAESLRNRLCRDPGTPRYCYAFHKDNMTSPGEIFLQDMLLKSRQTKMQAEVHLRRAGNSAGDRGPAQGVPFVGGAVCPVGP